MRVIQGGLLTTLLALGAWSCGASAPGPRATPTTAESAEPPASPAPSSGGADETGDGAAQGDGSAGGAASSPGAADADIDKAVATILKEIAAEKRWRGELVQPTDEFLEHVRGKLRAWGHALAILSAKGRDDQADRVAKAIVALRNHWGPTLLPKETLSSFPRDAFEVGPLRVLVVQFFEPVPYYPGRDTIMKLYQFLIYEQDRPVADYCLEHSNLAGDFYVLGRMDERSHAQIQPYGDRPPPYRVLRQRVIEDLKGSRDRQGPSMTKP